MGLVGSWALFLLGRLLKLDICVHGNLAAFLPSNSSWAHPVAVAEAGPFVRDPTWLCYAPAPSFSSPSSGGRIPAATSRRDWGGRGHGAWSILARLLLSPWCLPENVDQASPPCRGKEAGKQRQADKPPLLCLPLALSPPGLPRSLPCRGPALRSPSRQRRRKRG